MRRLIVLLTAMILLSSALFSSEVVFTSGSIVIEKMDRQFISIDDFYTLLTSSEDFLVLDNRKPEDWAKSNICNSVNADMDAVVTYGDYIKAIDIMKSVLKRETGSENGGGKKIILACYTGNRYAQAATNVLAYLGADLSKVYTLEGGNTAWDKSEYVQSVEDYKAAAEERKNIAMVSEMDWGNDFEFASRKGGSDMDLADVLDIMTITTPCAFESTSLDAGYNASFNYMVMEEIGGKEVIQGNDDKTVTVTFENGHKATAEYKWPEKTDIADGFPVPDGKNTKIVYAIYDNETLMIVFKKFEDSYLDSLMSYLRSAFSSDAVEGSGDAPFYKGKSSDGKKVSFSSQMRSLVIDK